MEYSLLKLNMINQQPNYIKIEGNNTNREPKCLFSEGRISLQSHSLELYPNSFCENIKVIPYQTVTGLSVRK